MKRFLATIVPLIFSPAHVNWENILEAPGGRIFLLVSVVCFFTLAWLLVKWRKKGVVKDDKVL